MPGAVADSSTLISLATIGRLSLLKEFHGKIFIPPAVWREVVVEGQGRPGSAEVEQARLAGWIEVVSPGNEDLVKLLKVELDEGEAEAIALALSCQPEVVFLDEAEARKTAQVYGLRKAGVSACCCAQSLKGRFRRFVPNWVNCASTPGSGWPSRFTARCFRKPERANDGTPQATEGGQRRAG